MTDVTKLRTYGMPENSDTVANFTLIKNGIEHFSIETKEAHLKNSYAIIYDAIFCGYISELFILLIIFVFDLKKNNFFCR
jgi:hypothetical protein